MEDDIFSHLVQIVSCLSRKRNELPTYVVLLIVCCEESRKNIEIISFLCILKVAISKIISRNTTWIIHSRIRNLGMSLVVQWLRFQVPTAGGPGSMPGQGTKIQLSLCYSQKVKKKQTKNKKLKIFTKCLMCQALSNILIYVVI